MEVEKNEDVHVKLDDVFEAALREITQHRPWRELDQIEKDEASGIVSYEFVTNDGTDESLSLLLQAKCLFGRQLPKMPKEYIVRLAFDSRHFCLVMKRKESAVSQTPSASPSPSETDSYTPKPDSPSKPPTVKTIPPTDKESVVAAVCFRPFNGFAEIAFLAVNSKEQVRGYGTRLMNHLKESLKTRGITDLVTYADNAAVGYFSKQGFYSPNAGQATKTDSVHHTCIKTGYDGYIKDYDGANKMVCCIYKDVDYLTLPTFRIEATAALWKAFNQMKNPTVHPGLINIPRNIYEIPGLEFLAPSPAIKSETPSRGSSRRRAGESLLEPPKASMDSPPRQRPVPSRLQVPTSIDAMVNDVIETALSNGSSWPFKEPVDINLAPDYYQVVRSPMDLSTMKAKNIKGLYKSLKELKADFKLMFENCLFYNGEDSIYAQAATILEKIISQRIDRLTQISNSSR